MSDTTKEAFITPARLKSERDWTDGLIKRFLAKPDKLAPNPIFPNAAAPMKLYATQRVEKVEATAEFAAAMKKAEARRDGAYSAVATKTRKMIDAMTKAEITIARGKTRDEIYALAHATHGGNYAGDPGEFYFNNRVAVNCIRHNLTNYESLWRLCNRGETGQEAYRVLRERVGNLIRETYPEYFEDAPPEKTRTPE